MNIYIYIYVYTYISPSRDYLLWSHADLLLVLCLASPNGYPRVIVMECDPLITDFSYIGHVRAAYGRRDLLLDKYSALHCLTGYQMSKLSNMSNLASSFLWSTYVMTTHQRVKRRQKYSNWYSHWHREAYPLSPSCKIQLTIYSTVFTLVILLMYQEVFKPSTPKFALSYITCLSW